MPATKNDK